jgi:hypothetical protein
MRWLVTGVDSASGKERSIEVGASDEQSATAIANKKGVFVESIVLVQSEPQPPNRNAPTTVLDYRSPHASAPTPIEHPPVLSRAPQRRVSYKVLTQKDKWFSQKFDPERLEGALNAYAKQGWRVCVGDTASFPGLFGANREELITLLERGGNSAMYEYKVLTQKDKWFSGKFDPERLEAAINAYAQQGWCVSVATTASFPGFFASNREEMIIIMERERAARGG